MPSTSSLVALPSLNKMGGKCPALVYWNRDVAVSKMPRKNVEYFSGDVVLYNCPFRLDTKFEVHRIGAHPVDSAVSREKLKRVRTDDCRVAINSAAEMPLPATSPIAIASRDSPSMS